MREVTFTMEDEQFDAIFVDRLKEDLESLRLDVRNMVMRLNVLQDHQFEDLCVNLEMIGALEKMLKYYMVRSEAEEFIEEMRDTYWPENLQKRFLKITKTDDGDHWDSWFEPSGEYTKLETDSSGRRFVLRDVSPKIKQRIYVDPED